VIVEKNAKIFVAGHNGLVGSSILRRLNHGGYDNLVVRTRQELDLLDQKSVFAFLEFERPDYVIIAAARVGGIMANNTYRADFIYENLVIEANLIHGSWLAGVRNLLFLGSSCIYPKYAPQPMPEECLLTGELEYTNEPYAIAKIAGIKMCESYNLQYGTNYLSVMPTNLYGQNDNFDLEKSHVLPALMRKFHLGKCLMEGDWAGIRKDFDKNPIDGINGSGLEADILEALDKYGVSYLPVSAQNVPTDGTGHFLNTTVITIWGNGTPRREFLFSDDLADACVYILENVNISNIVSPEWTEVRNTHINIGTGTDITIMELADLIKRVVGYQGEIRFDSTKPDGTPRKLQDVSRLRKLGWTYSTSLEEGLGKVYEFYNR
jgi:GDP-L-fucose synthase